ncbi:SLATT domain-containing protein [Niallia circulans]|nr:SLATT domain-containing protein [Niallia circulans]
MTRRARIKASSRLREKHEFFEKVSHFFSVFVLVLSIWFINSDNSDITKILLIASLALTFFSMFLGVKNYKERASNFETNYQQLSVLLNKLQRLETKPHLITETKLKELHREYEKLLIDKENHLDIDYMVANDEQVKKHKHEIIKYKQKELFIKILVITSPVIFMLAIYLIKKYVE